jgi:hypothetical protein
MKRAGLRLEVNRVRAQSKIAAIGEEMGLRK